MGCCGVEETASNVVMAAVDANDGVCGLLFPSLSSLSRFHLLTVASHAEGRGRGAVPVDGCVVQPQQCGDMIWWQRVIEQHSLTMNQRESVSAF